MSTEGLAALVYSYGSRVVEVEGAIYKAPEDGSCTRGEGKGQCGAWHGKGAPQLLHLPTIQPISAAF